MNILNRSQHDVELGYRRKRKSADRTIAFAYFSKIQGWFDEGKDENPQKMAKDMAELDPPVACKLISDQQGTLDKLEEMGLKMSFVGDIISGFVKDGDPPMVW